MHMRHTKRALDFESGELIALKALAFLASDEARLAGFLAATGLAPDELKARAAAASTLRAVLEHLAGDESLLLVFAADHGIPPQDIAPALRLLAGRREGSSDARG